MSDWRLAKSLITLREEINARAPKRSTASDGTIGDSAHAARASDHNPNRAGVVRAMDITDDPADGCDVSELMDDLVDLMRAGHPALGSGAYLIHDRRIISRDRLGEGWRRYDGANPHVKHGHISVAAAAAGYDSTRPWGVLAPATTARPRPSRGRDIDHALADIGHAARDLDDVLDATKSAEKRDRIRLAAEGLASARWQLLQIPRTRAGA